MGSPEGKALMRTFRRYQQSQWKESPSAIGPKSRAWSPQKQEMSLLASNAKENASIAARNAAMLGAGIMQSLPSLARAGSSVGRLAYQGLKDAYRSYQDNQAKQNWANENYPKYLEDQKNKDSFDAYNAIGKRMSKGARGSMKKGINWGKLVGLAENAKTVARRGRTSPRFITPTMTEDGAVFRSARAARQAFPSDKQSGMIGDGHQIADDMRGDLNDIAYLANNLAYSGAIKNPKVNRALSRMNGLTNYNQMDNNARYRNRQVPGFEAFAYELGNKKSKLQNAILGTGAAALGYSLINRKRQEQKAPMSGPMKKGINWARLASRGYGAAADAVRDNASRANRAVGYYSLDNGPRPPMRRGDIIRGIDVVRMTKNPWNGKRMFPAGYLTDAQANKISSLAGRAYNYGENQLAGKSDMLLDPRMARVYNNMKDRDANAAIGGLSAIAALSLAGGAGQYAYDRMKKKPTSATGLRGVLKRMSKSPKNKYGV